MIARSLNRLQAAFYGPLLVEMRGPIFQVYGTFLKRQNKELRRVNKLNCLVCFVLQPQGQICTVVFSTRNNLHFFKKIGLMKKLIGGYEKKIH